MHTEYKHLKMLLELQPKNVQLHVKYHLHKKFNGLVVSALNAVPSPAGKDVKSEPSPTNLVAVIIPVELILPRINISLGMNTWTCNFSEFC